MSAHTPPPWDVCGAEGCACKAVLYRDGVICEVKDFNDDMADASGHAPSPDEAQANKHLIAAAPELLEAARRALPLLEAAQRMIAAEAARRGMEPDDTLLNQIRAAIAKAEGHPAPSVHADARRSR